MLPFTRKAIEAINNYIVEPEFGCHIYQGDIDPSTGYGRIQIEGKRYGVHRLVCFLVLGLDLNDEKKFACHKLICPNRSCINSEHLYVGDNESNQLDAVNNLCKKGHPLIGDNVLTRTRKNGNTQRMCKICFQLYQKNYKANLRRVG